MKVDWNLENAERQANSVLTVGTFDGVHNGHKFILEELKKRGANRGAQTAVVTFNPHPQLVLKLQDRPAIQILTTIEEKIDILKDFGIDRAVVIEFTREFSNTNSVDFVRKDLFEKIGFCEIVIGHDHAFVKNREGGIRTLRSLGAKLKFAVDDLPAYEVDGIVLSSTKIRDLLRKGRIKEANDYLGRPYSFEGRVIEGDRRGRDLGFPTANLAVSNSDKLIPGDGVYAVYIELSGSKFKGMMNIGVRPTFGSPQHTAEVHIFDFNEDIYGKRLRVEFVDKIRDEFRFKNAAELTKQLQKDKDFRLDIL